jgi:hypothetical protein
MAADTTITRAAGIVDVGVVVAEDISKEEDIGWVKKVGGWWLIGGSVYP